MVGLSGLGLLVAGILIGLIMTGGDDSAVDPDGISDRAAAPAAAPAPVLPASTTTTTQVTVTTSSAGTASTTPPATVNLPVEIPPLPPPPPDPYYGSCAEARAAGVAPLYLGEPGYRPSLDRDKDGVACES